MSGTTTYYKKNPTEADPENIDSMEVDDSTGLPEHTGYVKNPDGVTPDAVGGRRRRKTMKKMSKRKMMKWCKSKKNRRTKAGRKMCKKMKK